MLEKFLNIFCDKTALDMKLMNFLFQEKIRFRSLDILICMFRGVIISIVTQW